MKIKIDGFFNRIFPYKCRFFDFNLLEKAKFYFMEKNEFEFWVESSIIWGISVSFTCGAAQKKRDLVQRCATCWSCLIGNLMEDFGLVVTKKEQFECHFFTISLACFGRIGQPQLQNRYRSIWLCNQVCLLKCKGYDWHWDGTNQNWVDLGQNDFEYGDIILTIKTLLGIFRVKFFWCKLWNWWFFKQILL